MRGSSATRCLLLFLAFGVQAFGAPPGDESKYVITEEVGSTREGKSLTLLCAIGGPPAASINPPPTYVWIKNGTIIPGETGKRLTLKSLRLQDEGEYQCGDPNSDVTREKYHLNVINAPRKFYVREIGSRLRGKMLTLECHPVGVDPSSFVWLKNGKVTPGETGKTFTLHILTSEDTGDYQCGDSNPDFPKLIHHVEVLWNVPRPGISKDREPVSGRPFYLECIITGNYPTGTVVYTWYKGSTEIKNQSGPVLSFDNLTEADAEQYTCTARDGPMDTTSRQSQPFYLNLLVAPSVQIKPVRPSSVLRGILGENITLTCEVSHAVPEVPYNGYSWSFLPSHRGPMLPLSETTRTITLGPLTRKDSGQYSCQAKNDQGFESLSLAGQASATVEVVYLENFALTPDLAVCENEVVTLACSVDSYPTAHIAWTVDGEEVRRVVDNSDHYVIPHAACTDSKNYTCHATNVEIPGLQKTGTIKLFVDCIQEESDAKIRRTVGLNNTHADTAASFDFLLPTQNSVLVVHPAGQVIVTVHPNCSLLISSAFSSRCLHLHCNADSHHLTFFLTQVTERDTGHYYCLEEKERRRIAYCSQTFFLRRLSSDDTEPNAKPWYAVGGIALGIVASFTLCIKLRHKIAASLYRMFSSSSAASSTETWTYEGSHNLEKLYKKGHVYMFPKLILPQKKPEDMKKENSSESTSLMIHSDEELLGEAAYAVKDLIRVTLQISAQEKDPPSFVLHNTRLSREENVILILSRKNGVVVMLVNAVDDKENLKSLEKSTEHLLEARKIVREKVTGLVHASSITAVIALPNLTDADQTFLREHVKILHSNRDVEVVFGKKLDDFKNWAARLSSRPDNKVWDCSHQEIDGPDTAFEETASRFLTLVGSCHPLESQKSPTVAETWLLTPEQMEVRDSTVRLLHMWGSPGSGKTMLLTNKARQWLADGKAVVIVVGREIYDAMLSHVADTISRELEKETTKKLRVCRTYSAMQDAIKELRAQYSNVEICIAIHTVPDAEIFEGMLQAVESRQASGIWSVCSENLHSLDKHLSEKAHKLGWETANLSLCVRCTTNTVELLNMLVKGSPDHDKIAPGSAAPVDENTKWEVLDHCRHPDHTSTMYNCKQCREKMNGILSLQGQHLKWHDWIALYAGDPSGTTDIKYLCTVLRTHGLPACLDIYDDILAGRDSRLNATDITSRTEWWKRMVDGVDERGNPAVHLVRVKDFSSGLEKGNVLLVHWDKRDDDPTHQSQDKSQQRLEEHRRQWIQGVSRSKGQVILLLLTPSPARSLLNLPEAALPVPEASEDLATPTRKP